MNCKNIYKCLVVIPLLAVILLMNGCADNVWDKHVSKDELLSSNLLEAIQLQPELSIFYSILKKTGYDQVLSLPNSYTVFAPTNTAWSAVDTTNVDQLRKMVGSMIVYKAYFSENAQLYKAIKSVNGKSLFYDGSTQTFNAAKIITADIRTANGAIQITDKVLERHNNIWEELSTKTLSEQFKFINSLNTKIMDTEKSVAMSVDPMSGKTIFDTVWKNNNNFLQKYRLDNEDSLYTYVVVENSGFKTLFDKYRKFFTMTSSVKTDSITNFNVCQDFVFKGIIDITKLDTITNVDGVKVPVRNAVISKTYNASNGRVYVIQESNIRLKDKIKPIKIEGEAFTRAQDPNYVFTRYKLWASGERDITMSCGESQTDTLWRKTTGVKDSISTAKTYFINSGLVANVANFYIEYKANVNSANYDVYYVAYDDIADHSDLTYTRFGALKIVQKLYMSMPGAPALKLGSINNSRSIVNNYLGDTRCFVGQGKAGIKETTKLSQWNLIESATSPQLIDSKVTGADAEVMTVPKTGTLTMWLCNSARSAAASRQGLLFLDYIMLVPKITEE